MVEILIRSTISRHCQVCVCPSNPLDLLDALAEAAGAILPPGRDFVRSDFWPQQDSLFCVLNRSSVVRHRASPSLLRVAGTRRRTVVLAAARVIAPGRDLRPGVVEIRDGRIVHVREGRERRADVFVRNGILAPGLIDLQINGAAGVDFLTCESDADLERAHHYLLSTGTTAYLATLISAPLVRLRAALVHWRRFVSEARTPQVLGLHLDGPYLNPSFAGAHAPGDLRAPNAAEFETLLAMANRTVKLVTLAPELPGAADLIRVARKRGVAISAGHTAATYEEARAAFAQGMRMVTHVFNAMRPVHHRDPGIAVAALADPAVTVGMIADLIHVHPAMIRMAIELKGFRRIALVTDAIAAAGSAGATTLLGGQRVTVQDAPRLADGTLAGSTLALDQAVRNVVSLGVPVREAILMASQVPASVLRRRDIGRIASGARADFVVFDRDLRVGSVYVEGEVVYSRVAPGRR